MISIVLFYVTLFLLSLGQIGRISFFGQQVNIYLFEIPLLLFTFIQLWTYRLTPFKSHSKLSYAFIIFTSVMVLTFLMSIYRYNPFQNFVAFLYLGRLFFYLLAGVYLATHTKRSLSSQKHIKIGLIMYALCVIVFSILQYVLYPDLRNLYYLGWDPHLSRVFGTFFDPPITAATFGLLLIYFFFAKTNLKRGWHYLLLGLLFILFIATFSRGGYMGFLVTGAYYVLRHKKYIIAGGVIVAFILVLLLLPKSFGEGVNLLRTSTIESRLTDYQNAFKIVSSAPIFGIGYNHIRYELGNRGLLESKNFDITHSGASFQSSYLIILTTTGIFGLLSFLYLLFIISRNHEVVSYFVILLGTMSLTDNVLLHPFIILLVSVLMSAVIVRRKR